MSTLTATPSTTRIPALRGAADLVGRSLLASLFVISGLGKLAAYAGTAGYMESVGVPGALLPLVIALEVLFHSNLGDEIQQIMFLKNFALAGGFITLAARGAGGWSIDNR